METRIGEVFREARRRRQVGLEEVEAATKIRPRYLRAIEEEEWDALPGGFYTRGFIRAYASFLGLDGERLAEDYREGIEGASREWAAVPEPPPTGAGARRRGVPAAGWLAALAVVGLAALVIVLLPGGGDEPNGPVRRTAPQPGPALNVTKREGTPRSGTSVRLTANGEVWVCLLDGAGKVLVAGEILAAGAEAGPFRSDSFTVSFGNGEVSMLIDGKEAPIPPSASPVGYSIDAAGKLTTLAEVERPTCT